MDESTPLQLITTSVETLRQAITLAQQEENALLIPGIEKAIGILEVLVTSSEEPSNDSAVDIPDDFSYTSTVLPIEALLTPISEDTPGGDNLRLSGEVKNLLSLVVNRYDPHFKPQYKTLYEQAVTLLTKRGKDLGVAVRLTEAAIADEEHSGFAAVADGLVLINGFFTMLWDVFYPQCDDGDCMLRCSELEQFEQLVIVRLAARYKQPHEFTPHYTDINTAGTEAAVFTVITEQLAILKKTTYDKMPDQSPSFKDLENTLRIYGKRVNEQFNSFRQTLQQKRDNAVRQKELQLEQAINQVTEQLDNQQKDKEEEAAPATTEPRDMHEVERLLESSLQFLSSNNPADPLSYSIRRGRLWFSGLFAISHVDPTAGQRQEIESLFTAQQWDTLFQRSEELFINGTWHWLDLQRYQIMAAEQLGASYKSTAEYLESALLMYVAMNRDVLEKTFDDTIPVATDETKQWITSKLTTVSGDHGSNAASHNQSDSIFIEAMQKATELAENGKPGSGLNLLLTRQKQACSKREHFLWQLTIAEFCIQSKLTKIVFPGIDHIVATIDQLNLAEWEDPDLLSRAYKIGHNGYLSLGIDRAPQEKLDYFYQKICLYDPAHFISEE